MAIYGNEAGQSRKGALYYKDDEDVAELREKKNGGICGGVPEEFEL